jgi:hypothetical protein
MCAICACHGGRRTFLGDTLRVSDGVLSSTTRTFNAFLSPEGAPLIEHLQYQALS